MENKISELNQRLLKDIMNIMIPKNDEIPAAGDMGLYKQIEKHFLSSNNHKKSIISILESINLHPNVRISGSFFSIDLTEKIEIIRWHEENMIDDFNKFKESIFAVYYSDERVVRKINWGQEKVKKIEPKWDPSILEKVKKIEPFWKKF
tara:strand:+ start:2693 stop:3139 length:447 start_codon:yes stop_codon:yes gene_type:complete